MEVKLNVLFRKKQRLKKTKVTSSYSTTRPLGSRSMAKFAMSATDRWSWRPCKTLWFSKMSLTTCRSRSEEEKYAPTQQACQFFMIWVHKH